MAETIGLIAIFDTKQFSKGLNEFVNGTNKVNDAAGNAEKKTLSLAKIIETALGNALVEVGKLAVDLAINVGKAFIGTVNDAISLESAFAGVAKTTDGLITETRDLTDAGIEMKDGFRDLAKEIPVSVENLMSIGEIGGQLGIGRENLLEFTETIAAMGEATNLTAEQAAVGMAQFANVMGTPQTEVDNLGSAIVYLGNNFATTESGILAFGSRLAGAGAIVGLTEGDVLGISTAFSSVGVNAEAGGTAIQKVLININDAVNEGSEELDIFAETAGLSVEEFSTLWEEDAAGAFAGFVNGLGEAGDSATGILDDLGLADQRVATTFLKMAQNGDLLTGAIDGANSAFEDNTALTKEAETRYATTESQIKIMKNNFRDLGFTIGESLLPAVNEFIEGVLPILEEAGPGIAAAFTLAGDAITNVVGFISNFISESGGLTGIWENIKTTFSENEFIQEIIEKFSGLVDEVIPLLEYWKEQGSTILSALKDNWSIIWDGIKGTVMGAVDIITGFIGVFLNIMSGDWKGAWESVKTIVGGVFKVVWGIIKGAFGVILTIFGTNLDTLLTTISQIWQIIKAVTGVAWEAIKQFMTNTWTSISEWFVTAFNNFIAFFVNGFESAKEWIATAWENITTTISTAIDNIFLFISNTFTSILEFISNVWQNILIVGATIWQAISDTITIIVGTFLAIITGDTESSTALLGAIWEKISGVLSVVWEKISSVAAGVWAVISTALANAWTFIKDTAVNVFNSIMEWINTTWENIKTGVVEAWENINKSIADALRNLNDFMAESWEKIKEKTSETWEKIKKAIPEAWENINKSVTEALEGMSEFLTQAWEDIKTGAVEAWENMITAIADTARGITDAVSEGLDAAIEFLSTVDLSQIGQDIIQGLIDGIVSMATAVGDAVGNAVNGAIDNAKKLLLVESPSKVFAEIGVNTMKGFAGGINDSANLPESAVTRAVGNVVSSTTNVVNNYDYSRSSNIEITGSGNISGDVMFFDIVGALSVSGVT